MSNKLAFFKPKVQIYEKEEEVDELVSKLVVEQIKKKSTSVLILPTGSTPLGMYERIILAYKRGEVDFSKTTIINIDEYFPIKKNHPGSYYYYMKHNLIDSINVKVENWHIASGEEPLEKSITMLCTQINKIPIIDLAVCGLGPGKTCHIGFNEQGTLSTSTIHFVKLSEETIKANRRLFLNPKEMPKGAITLGICDILRARKIILIAKGKAKAWGIKRTLTGQINEDAPASYLRYHKQTIFVLDKEAASLLPNDILN